MDAWEKQQDAVSLDASVSGAVVSATNEMVVTAVARDESVILFAHDAANGGRRWQRQIQYPNGFRYPRFGGLVDGFLFLTDSGTDVVAVDTSDGTVRWRINLYERVAETVPDRFLVKSGYSPDWFSPLPLATPETVYIQSSYGIHGLAPKDGREQWRIHLENQNEDEHVLGEPGGLALTDDRIWTSYGNPRPAVYEIELFDESPTIERTTAPLKLPGRPVVTSDGNANIASQVIWSTDTHEPLAFGAAGGTGVTWQFPGLASSGAAAFSSLSTDGERVFVCEGHEQKELFVVFALRASTGEIEWIFRDSLTQRNISAASPAEFRLCQPVVAGDTLLAGYGVNPDRDTGQGNLVALSTNDGHVRWRNTLPIAPEDVAVAGDRVYVGGRQKGVVAFAIDEN